MAVTIRDVINKKKRTGVLVCYAGVAIMFAASFWAAVTDTVPVLALLGFPFAIGGMVYSLFWTICPSCKLRIGHMAMYSGGPFSISKKFRFCPYCGVDLDSEVKRS